VRAADVLWFEAGGKAMLHVVGVRKGQRIERELPGRRLRGAEQRPRPRGRERQPALEQILKERVASEIFHSAPEATLRAQAVAARHGTCWPKSGRATRRTRFAICSEVHCQAVHGRRARSGARIAQAVQDTRGLVMVDKDGPLD